MPFIVKSYINNIIKIMSENILSKGDHAALEGLLSLGFADVKGALKNLKLLSLTHLKGSLDRVINAAAASPSPDGALNNLETIVKELPSALLLQLLKDPQNIDRLITVCGSSPMLSNNLAQNAANLEWLFIKGGIDEVRNEVFLGELKELTRDIEAFDPMARALRVYRNKEFLRIGVRDLLGLAGVTEITRELSDLASACLEAAVEFSLKNLKKTFGNPLIAPKESGGCPVEAEFAVIGLGKLGGRELNFSSDVDIIYIYSDDKGETSGVGGKEDTRISLHDFFVRVSMTVNKLLSSVTGDGFVFRIDLDLRPEGRSGDMANSLRSIEIYYESWGQPWERTALIKARCVAGSQKLGEAFASMLRPFVYRRYLDFTAIEEIKSMKEKIDLSLLRRNPDAVDVKLGAGGIREVEFFCQALQLIHGGRDSGIREKNTVKAIERLLSKGHILKDEATTLTDGYIFLRNLEHRIQIVEGRQTQAIPARPAELERLAKMMGFKDTPERKAGEYFWEEYKKKTSSIHEIFRTLFYKSEEELFKNIQQDILLLFSPDITEEESIAKLPALGFKDTKTAFKNLSLLKSGPATARLSSRAAFLLQRLSPRLLSGASSSPDPDMALSNLERFVSAIGARTAFYSLLAENAKAADVLLDLFGTSAFLSRNIVERPENLDILLSKEVSIPYKTKEALFKDFIDEISDTSKDYEEKLDSLRRLRHQEVFRIGINDIAGALTADQASAQMTFLAEASLEASYRVAFEELIKVYGRPAASRFAIIGLGKLGGGELIYGSDLDIIFVYSDAGTGEGADQGRTSGPKEISNHEFFVKLGQRIISVLTVRTKEGFLFNVDTRLRPSGSSGPLVVSHSSIIRYHKGKTSVWERQALIKARGVAGDGAYGGKITEGLEEIIYEKGLTKDDILEMIHIRKRMEAEIAKEDSSRYNIKAGKGGIVDIEFTAQAMQLMYGRALKSLRTPVTLKALSRLSKEGLLQEADYKVLRDAYAFLRLLEARLRIVEDRPEGFLLRDPARIASLARRAGYTGADAAERLLKDYGSNSEKVRILYLKTLEGLSSKLRPL